MPSLRDLICFLTMLRYNHASRSPSMYIGAHGIENEPLWGYEIPLGFVSISDAPASGRHVCNQRNALDQRAKPIPLGFVSIPDAPASGRHVCNTGASPHPLVFAVAVRQPRKPIRAICGELLLAPWAKKIIYISYSASGFPPPCG
ncbi:hypothetical protein BA6E_11349 [Bacteroidales bacterium 6E]|nr:hypothetical protein BA6E_11349 [Bacteroidales bacterium 6E]